MNKAKLVFSDDGKSVKIVFGDNTESESYSTKESAVSALRGFYKEEPAKISNDDYVTLGFEILENETLPLSSETGNTSGIKISVVALRSPFGGRGISGLGNLFGMMGLASMLNDDDEYEPEKLTNPHFEMCNAEHAHIHFDEGRTGAILSKKHAKSYVDDMLKKEQITEADYALLLQAIADSPLPEQVENDVLQEN